MKDHGEFIIHSFSNQPKKYFINFGNEKTMPSCTCGDWEESTFLCKHFFAVFKKYPETWGWEALFPLYKSSPFLTLDLTGEVCQEIYRITPEDDSIENEKSCDLDHTQVLSEGEQKPQTLTGIKTSEIRDILNQLKSITYELEDHFTAN